jgi:hypothetical protein
MSLPELDSLPNIQQASECVFLLDALLPCLLAVTLVLQSRAYTQLKVPDCSKDAFIVQAKSGVLWGHINED